MKLVFREDTEVDGTVKYVVFCGNTCLACTDDKAKAKGVYDDMKSKAVPPSSKIIEEVEI